MKLQNTLLAEFFGTFWLVFGGCGDHSPGQYSMFSALVAEVVLTFFFLLIILGAALAGVVYPLIAGKTGDECG